MRPSPTLRAQILWRLAALLAGLLVLLGAFQYFMLQTYLRRRTADSLRLQVRSTWTTLAAGGTPDPRDLVAALASANTQVLIYSPGGSQLLSRGGPREPLRLGQGPAQGQEPPQDQGPAPDQEPSRDQESAPATPSGDEVPTRAEQSPGLPLGPGPRGPGGRTGSGAPPGPGRGPRFLLGSGGGGAPLPTVDSYSIVPDTRGVPWLAVQEPLGARTHPVAFAVVATPVQELNATLAALAALTALGGAAGLALALLLAGRLLRGALRPLGDLAAAAGAIAAGDWERRAAASGSREVNQVAGAFNHMLDRIQAAFEREHQAQEQMRRFLADAAHELRTPITALNGFVEVLQAGAGREPTQLDAALTTMRGEGLRLARLVESLLQLARLDDQPELPLTRLDLAALLRELEPALALAAKDHRLTLHTLPAAPVQGNADALRQVVWNLVDNARQHSPAGSEIAVTCRYESGSFLLTVADQGEGIAPEDLPHVFERFYRGDPSRTRRTGGSGLGLSIVQSIVRAHGGEVSIASTVGSGTQVTLRLPADATPRSLAGTPSPAKTSQGGAPG